MTTLDQAVHAMPGLDTAVRRWKSGHQLFHLHLAAMNSTLTEAVHALDTVRWVELAAALDRLRMLYDAATATMRYAADFSPELYDRVIRPSMAPPLTSPGFSGSLNIEHEQMLAGLRELRRRIKVLRRAGELPDPVHEAATRLLSAQSRNRRNHVFVCTRFVPEGTSLLDAHFQAREQDRTDTDPADPTEANDR